MTLPRTGSLIVQRTPQSDQESMISLFQYKMSLKEKSVSNTR
jgi:hypothetical protein